MNTSSKIKKRGSELSHYKDSRNKSQLRKPPTNSHRINAHRVRATMQASYNPLLSSNPGNPNGPNQPNHSPQRTQSHRRHRRTVKIFKRWLTSNSQIGNDVLSISQDRRTIMLSEEQDFDPLNPEDYLSSDSPLTDQELSRRLRQFCREMIRDGLV
eukprot:245845_1